MFPVRLISGTSSSSLRQGSLPASGEGWAVSPATPRSNQPHPGAYSARFPMRTIEVVRGLQHRAVAVQPTAAPANIPRVARPQNMPALLPARALSAHAQGLLGVSPRPAGIPPSSEMQPAIVGGVNIAPKPNFATGEVQGIC